MISYSVLFSSTLRGSSAVFVYKWFVSSTLCKYFSLLSISSPIKGPTVPILVTQIVFFYPDQRSGESSCVKWTTCAIVPKQPWTGSMPHLKGDSFVAQWAEFCSGRLRHYFISGLLCLPCFTLFWLCSVFCSCKFSNPNFWNLIVKYHLWINRFGLISEEWI